MLYLIEKRLPLIGIFLCLGIFASAFAAPQSTDLSIFRFQQTMAEKGQATAQYKLAMMYETGKGIEQNIEQARLWYGRAALQNYKPARHRLTYLDIRQNGFTPAHQIWLKDLMRDAESKDGEALFLLGQMQAEGIGMPRDLNQSARSLRQAAAINVPGSDSELARVEALLVEMRATEQKQKLAAQRVAHQQTEKRTIEAEEKQRILRQKQLADQQRQREAQAIAEQQRLLNEKYQPKPRTREVTDSIIPQPPRIQREAELMIEEDNSPCSGRNRFVATCR
jgi:TPR repeat protein